MKKKTWIEKKVLVKVPAGTECQLPNGKHCDFESGDSGYCDLFQKTLPETTKDHLFPKLKQCLKTFGE